MSYLELFLEELAGAIETFGKAFWTTTISPEMSSAVLTSVGVSVVGTGAYVLDADAIILGPATSSLGTSIITNAGTAYSKNQKLAMNVTQEYVKCLSEDELLEMKELLLAKKALLDQDSEQSLTLKL